MKPRFAAIVAAAGLASCQYRPPSSTGSAERSGEGGVPRQLPSGNATVNGPVLSYAPIVRVVAPAVVTVRASHRVQTKSSRF